MTLQTNLYRLRFVIPALFDWPKERFSNHFDEKYGKSNHVSSLLVFPMLSDWFKVITFRMLPDAIFSNKIHEQLCFHFKFWRAVEKRSVHFILLSQGGRKSLFSINFCRCLTVGKSIHQDFGTNFTHLLVGNHLNFEHKIKTNWSTMTRRENLCTYIPTSLRGELGTKVQEQITISPGLNWLDAHLLSRHNKSCLSFAKIGQSSEPHITLTSPPFDLLYSKQEQREQ